MTHHQHVETDTHRHGGMRREHAEHEEPMAQGEHTTTLSMPMAHLGHEQAGNDHRQYIAHTGHEIMFRNRF